MESGNRGHGGAVAAAPGPLRGEWRSLVLVLAVALAVAAASQWWGRQREAALGAEISGLARPGDIRMLSSTTCVFCAEARRWLDEHRVAYTECFIEHDAACAAAYQATWARGTPTLLVRGQTQLGFDAPRVLAALTQKPASTAHPVRP